MNLHFHGIFLDGICTRGADDRLSFRRVVPHTADAERLVVRIAEAWLSRQGFGPEEEGEVEKDDAQAVIQQASLLGKVALGERAGKRARRVQLLGGRELALPPRGTRAEPLGDAPRSTTPPEHRGVVWGVQRDWVVGLLLSPARGPDGSGRTRAWTSGAPRSG